MGVQEKKPGRNTEKNAGFFRKYKVIVIGIAVAFILIAAILIGVLTGRSARQASSDPVQKPETQSQTLPETESAETAVVYLEEDAHPAINALMQDYYQAATEGNVEKLKALAESIDEETLIYQEKRSAYIESYQNLKCYTKAGPVENSYVAYVSYDVKFKDMDSLVPGVSPYLVYGREDGTYYIFEGEVDENVNNYLEEISAQDDVVDLMNRVQVKFNETVVADEELNNFLAQMRKNLKVEVGEALAEAEAAQTEEEQPVEEPEAVTAKEVKATDVVNVRASDSEQAEKLGKVQVGEVLPLLESKANGWTKVEYEGREAYIKSDYLEVVAVENTDESGNGEQAADSGNQTDDGKSSSVPGLGTITVGDTINIRKAASQTADKLGVCYQGDKLEIVMKRADGWTEVKYKGQTGYVKTDVLKVLE